MINNSFSNLLTNRFDRMFGGTTKGTADPYLTGYQFVCFYQIPNALSTFVNLTPPGGGANGVSSPLGPNEIQNILAASNLSVNPPGITQNRTEFQALGGLKYTMPTNFDLTNSFSMRFLEYSGRPIGSIFHGWANLIRQYRNGTAGLEGVNLSKTNYASTILYWTTKPDGLTVEYYACYTGAWPIKDPQDSYAGDIAAIDKLEIDMEFAIDWAYHEPWVKTLCSSLAQQYKNEGIKQHGSSIGGANTVGSWETPGS